MKAKARITRFIKWQINSGRFNLGEKIPSEHFLATKFGCSRLTARSSLTGLVDEGYVKPQKGKGYFVEKKIIVTSQQSDNIKTIDYYSKHVCNVNAYEERMFKEINDDFDSKDFCFAFVKVYDNGSLLWSNINTRIIDVKDAQVEKSLAEFFARKNIEIGQRDEIVVIEKANKLVQEKLSLKEDTDIVAIYSMMLNLAGEIVEAAVIYITKEEFKFKKSTNY